MTKNNKQAGIAHLAAIVVIAVVAVGAISVFAVRASHASNCVGSQYGYRAGHYPSGGCVSDIQTLVNWHNVHYHTNGQISTDGVYGPNTAAAVKAVQRHYGLTADGIVGPNTWSAICHPHDGTQASYNSFPKTVAHNAGCPAIPKPGGRGF